MARSERFFQVEESLYHSAGTGLGLAIAKDFVELHNGTIKVQKSKSSLLENFEDNVLKIPIAHFEGRYYVEPQEIENLQNRNLIAFRYCNQKGEVNKRFNPNGSVENIAGLVNDKGNVLGMMPHPERASFDYLGSMDGRIIFD